jgi:hypothetical protein
LSRRAVFNVATRRAATWAELEDELRTLWAGKLDIMLVVGINECCISTGAWQ